MISRCTSLAYTEWAELARHLAIRVFLLPLAFLEASPPVVLYLEWIAISMALLRSPVVATDQQDKAAAVAFEIRMRTSVDL